MFLLPVKQRHIFSLLFNTVAVIGCSRMSSTYKNHKTLADFGYAFNDNGELRDIKTDKPFKFVDQQHYEALGEVISDEVYKLLQEKAGLQIKYLNNDKTSFVFVSPDYDKKESLLFLIHGSGVVRAGQWARKLIINHDLSKGTQIPYIQEAMKLGLGVVVFNTNQNYIIDEDGVRRKISGSSTPEEHALKVWNKIVMETNPLRNIIIVAHSYGGVVTMSLAQEVSFTSVKGIFFTDSVHYLTKALNAHLLKIGKNYVTSDQPVGTLLKASDKDIHKYSAGDQVHEWTSWAAQDNIFQDIKRVLDAEANANANANADADAIAEKGGGTKTDSKEEL